MGLRGFGCLRFTQGLGAEGLGLKPTSDESQMGASGNKGYLKKGSYYLGYYIRVPYFRKPSNLALSRLGSRQRGRGEEWRPIEDLVHVPWAFGC